MNSERKSNILVTVVDVKTFGAFLRGKIGDKFPPQATLTIRGGLAYVMTERGTFFLDTEGYGPAKPVEEEPVEIEFSREDIMTIGGEFTAMINKDNFKEIPILPDKVPLAEYIRTFGARLESNFEQWNKHLTECKPLPEWIRRQQGELKKSPNPA